MQFDVRDLKRSLISVYIQDDPLIIGSMADFPPSAQNIWCHNDPRITVADLGYLTAICELKFNGQSKSQVDIDFIINSIYTNRATYTYASPTIDISGNNSAPTGNYINPVTTPGDGNSDCNWFWNGTYHEPLTGKAQIYYLMNGPSHGTDIFNHWVFTYTA